jgi:hypothetical protein
MLNEEYEDSFAFAKADISTFPELGFITLKLIRFDSNPLNGLVEGLIHRLRPEHVQDLIAHLQASLDQYDRDKKLGVSSFPKH